ncbi:hypothetical protein KA977_12360, partial [Candidatus Dependentiae bacterium]|nr:hypothetical protein [Candidatus Dependentiae bacterium]
TRNIIKIIGLKYAVPKLIEEVSKENSTLYGKDVYICLRNIVDAVAFKGKSVEEKFKALSEAKNIYNQSIFSLSYDQKSFLIKNLPDFDEVIDNIKFFRSCFSMNIYNMANTILTMTICQITGYDLNTLFLEGISHIERFIQHSLFTNKNWDLKTLQSNSPKLIIPIGAAGCGKSTFYKELGNVINISCDNVRYLLFKQYGPCFQSWESSLSWWVVNTLTDYYLNRGYSVFYNGVNTDAQYRSPMTMEVHDSIYEGLKYNIKLVYFEPPVKLNHQELQELKNINLWAQPIEKMDFSKISSNVRKIMEMIKNNFERTMQRTKEIRDGIREQDPFDILYSVPAPIVKMFVEQNFDVPNTNNVTIIPRKEIPDENERIKFYRSYTEKLIN